MEDEDTPDKWHRAQEERREAQKNRYHTVLALRKEGKTYREIAGHVDLSVGRIRQIIAALRKQGRL